MLNIFKRPVLESIPVMRTGIIIVTSFFGLILGLHFILPTQLPPTWIFESALVLPLLNTFFICLIPLVVAYISARAYLFNGALNVLLLSCGMLSMSSSLLFATWLQSAYGANVGVTIHNIGVFSASIFHFAGAMTTLMDLPQDPEGKHRKRKLYIGGGGILAFTSLLAVVSAAGTMPVFYLQGVGFSLLRQEILGIAIFLFASSSFLLMGVFSRQRNAYLFWYSLGLMLFGVGLFGVWVQREVGGPIGWTGRFAQFFSGIYFLNAALVAIHSAYARSISLSEAVAGFFRESELNLKNILETIADAVIPVDANGRILTWNSSARGIFGYSREEVVGFPITKIISSVSKRSLSEEIPQSANPAPSYPKEMNLKRRNGERFQAEVSCSTRNGTRGKLTTFVIRDITERKRVGEALQRTEERARLALRAAQMAAWDRVLPDGEVIWNDEHHRMLGYVPGEITPSYDAWAERVHPDDLADAAGRFQRSLDEGGEFSSEFRVVWPDGRIRWVEARGQSERDPAGRLTRSYGVMLDITERKQAEEVLKESEERFRTLAEATFEGIAITEEGRFVDLNERFALMTGYPISELLGMNVSSLLPEEDRARVLANIISGGESVTEHRVIRRDGRIITVEAHGKTVRRNGRGCRFTAIRDITDRKRMEGELRRSRDELEIMVQERTAEIKKQAELIELSHDAFLVMDLGNRIIFWSKGAEEVYGWRKEEVLGKITHRLFQTHFPVPLPEIIAELMEKGHWEGELCQFRRDGRKITVLSRWAVQRDESGRAMAILETNSDITQRKKVEEQLRQAQKMEALGTLAGGIAHDFNNLLMPILVNTEMALMDIKDGVLPSPESMETTIAGANRGKELVQQIITFSRHKGEEPKPVDIAPIIKETIKFLRPAIPPTIRLETRIEDPSPLVLANPTHIHQILMNLVRNAVPAMEDSGILEISLEKVFKEASEGMKAGSYICLTVKDTGHGMSPEVKERAFDPFFTTKAPGKGTGMGLAVVHGIVKKHGGEIRLESELGKGTTVSIFLPVFQGPKKEEVPSPSPGPPTGNETILH